MKRKRHTAASKRPVAPRVEPDARELEAEIFATAFARASSMRLHPF
jgi:hypothetical protein